MHLASPSMGQTLPNISFTDCRVVLQGSSHEFLPTLVESGVQRCFWNCLISGQTHEVCDCVEWTIRRNGLHVCRTCTSHVPNSLVWTTGPTACKNAQQARLCSVYCWSLPRLWKLLSWQEPPSITQGEEECMTALLLYLFMSGTVRSIYEKNTPCSLPSTC